MEQENAQTAAEDVAILDGSVEDLAVLDSAFWAKTHKIQLQAGPFSFENREFQLEPMQSQARRKCYRKGTQQGVTEFETILNTLHGMIYGKYKKGVLVLFPTADNVIDFSKSRFGPIIAANRNSIGKYVKPGGRKGTDTASLKKVNDAFLYLRGARLSQTLGGGVDVKESVNLRSAPVDCVKFEEMDLISDDVIGKARGRMGDSDIGEEVYISNPTLPDFGIDAIFSKSDQRFWLKRCVCGVWTSPENTFPECVAIQEDGTGIIACPKCGRNIGPRSGCKGEWVPTARDNTNYMEGWHLSHLMSPAIVNDPAEILEDFTNPPQGNLSDVMRLRLGFPHIAAEDKLTVNQVLALCNQDTMFMGHKGPCAMGVDVGKIKHVVIGVRTGDERFQILKIARLSEWNDIHDLAQKFNVRSTVIDIRPYEDMVRAFQAAEPYRIFLCEYSDNAMHDAVWNNKSGIVTTYRTGIFDKTHRLIDEARLIIPRKSTEITEFVTQVCGCAKVAEIHKRTGDAIYRYRSLGSAGDHYRNALNYFILAADGGKLAKVGSRHNRQKVAKCVHAWS